MNARTKLNLVLALAVIALAGGTWYAKQHRKADEKKPPLTALAAASIQHAQIEWPGSPTISLEKKDQAWRLTAPVQGRADSFEVLALTNLAAAEVKQTLTPEGLDLKELGLAPPDHSITLNDVKIEFGGVDPLEYRRYVRIGDRVMLIDDPASAALDKDYHDLVDKNVFAADEEPVKLELPQGLTLSRDDKGEWSASPASAAATPAVIKKLIADWKQTRSMWNEAGDTPAPTGESVRFTLKDGSTREYRVAATDPQFSLYSPALNIRYQLSKALADELLKIPEPAKEDSKPQAATAEPKK